MEKRQVLDIPPVQIEVMEHQAEIKICPRCGTRNKADFPEGVTQSLGYGPEFQSRIAYWNPYQIIPLERVCEMAEDLYGHRPAEGTVLDICREGADRVRPVRSAVQEYLKEQGS